MTTPRTHALTLRIDEELDDCVTAASYDAQLSKTDWIRRAIHQSLSSAFNRNVDKLTGRLR
jgi:hypothetical protein